MSHIQQCPRCELRFRSESELRWHLTQDHDEDAQTLAATLEHTEAERHREARQREQAARRGIVAPRLSQDR